MNYKAKTGNLLHTFMLSFLLYQTKYTCVSLAFKKPYISSFIDWKSFKQAHFLQNIQQQHFLILWNITKKIPFYFIKAFNKYLHRPYSFKAYFFSISKENLIPVLTEQVWNRSWHNSKTQKLQRSSYHCGFNNSQG